MLLYKSDSEQLKKLTSSASQNRGQEITGGRGGAASP